MQGFIDKKYYVFCRSPKEIHQFLVMCENANLLMRNGIKPADYLQHSDVAIFAYNWAGSNDHVSLWTTKLHDGKLPLKPLADIIPLCKNQSIPDFLDLL